MVIWDCAAMLQYCYDGMLVLGYACSIGMVVLYLKLENPETNLDRQSGLFNHSALVQYIRQLYSENRDFAVLAVTFKRSFQKNMAAGQTIKMEIVEYLLGLSDTFVFKNAEDEIILVFKDSAKAEKGLQALSARFEEGWGQNGRIRIRPRWIYIPDARILSNVEDILYLIRDSRQNSKEFSENPFFQVDKKRADEMYKKKRTEQMILEAMEKDWVEVYYQPIYSTKEQRFTSA